MHGQKAGQTGLLNGKSSDTPEAEGFLISSTIDASLDSNYVISVSIRKKNRLQAVFWSRELYQ